MSGAPQKPEPTAGGETSSPADVVLRLPVGELTWDDLVLPDGVKATLRALGDSAVTGGLVVVLHGPPRSGKTFAAQVWAESMRLDLWKVDGAALVARHGQRSGTRGLDEVLPFGERPHAVLLFHDADALARPAAGDALAALVGRAAARRPPTVLEVEDAVLPAVRTVVPEDTPFVAIPSLDSGGRALLWERLVHRASPLSVPDLAALAAVEAPSGAIADAVRAVVLERGDERLETDELLGALRAVL